MNAAAIAGLIRLAEKLADLMARHRVVKKEILPLVEKAGEIVKSTDFDTNVARREWVVAELMKQGLKENDARSLTEAGLRLYKKIQAKIAKRAAKKAQG